MIKRTLLFCLIMIFSFSLCFARDPVSGYGTHINIEFKAADNKFYTPPIIGHLEYTGNSIDIVSYTEGIAGIGIITNAVVYIIIEKKIVAEGLHHIKGKNQYGIIASGTIDFRDQYKPIINLVTENGVAITNISSAGKVWQKKNMPNFVSWQ